MRDELGVELDERDYARSALTAAELKELFVGKDPRDFLNPKSPAFKDKHVNAAKLTAAQAIALMAEDPRIIKRPLTVVRGEIIAGFDRDRLRKALG